MGSWQNTSEVWTCIDEGFSTFIDYWGKRGKGGRDNPVSWKVYQDSERTYQSAIQKYMAIGQELNNAGHLVF